MSHSILVVEDDVLFARELEAFLRDLGYVVLGPADSAEYALQLLEKVSPDLAILDIKLKGGIDGITLSEKLPAGVPVIFLSDQERHLEAARRNAGQHTFNYFPKPIGEFKTLGVAVAIAIEAHDPSFEGEKPDAVEAAQVIEYLRQHQQLPLFAIPTPARADWRYEKIDIKKIIYFSTYHGSGNKYEGIELFLENNSYLIPGKSLTGIVNYLKKLGCLEFIQINQKEIINFTYINSYKASKETSEVSINFENTIKTFNVSKIFKSNFDLIFKNISFKY